MLCGYNAYICLWTGACTAAEWAGDLLRTHNVPVPVHGGVHAISPMIGGLMSSALTQDPSFDAKPCFTSSSKICIHFPVELKDY